MKRKKRAEVLAEDDKPPKKIENGHDDRKAESLKKGFWSRLFGS
ncbi:hypothetical protein M6K109_2646 [Staphylococcus aureus]|nr:hypothetical protein M6K109_2646 [Staphylococcus aureus]